MKFYVRQWGPRPLREWWFDESEIDFDPVYQRKSSIWGVQDRQKLIDTVLNRFDIPKIYLAEFSGMDPQLNPKGRRFAVIDGKQRLQALFDFFNGNLALHQQFSLDDNPSLELGGLRYNDLKVRHPELADRYASFELTVMIVVTDSEARINEMFLRLNTSKPLTGAEKRNAMLGEVPALIRQLARHPFWSHVRFDTLRGQDLNVSAKLLLLEHAGTFVDTKKSHLDRLVSDPHDVAMRARRRAVTDTMRLIEGVIEINDDIESDNIARSAERVSATLERLEPHFGERDSALSQQAQLPIIYLVARETSDEDLPYLRPFLVAFQRQREANRALTADDAQRDTQLSEYEILARTSNDQSSIRGRFRILLARFQLFVAFARTGL
jgi:hypothetical protein